MADYVIAGHGQGDSGAVGGGYTEAERVRALGKRIQELSGGAIKLLDPDVNWYATRRFATYNFGSGDRIAELHMDSAGASARGAHVIIWGGFSADDLDKTLAAKLSAIFPGRSQTIVGRKDLRNPNICARRGINYRLVENGFISNADDRDYFNDHLDEIAKIYVEAFGHSVTGSTSTSTGTKQSSTKKTSTTTKKSGAPSGRVNPKQTILLHDGYFGPVTVKWVQTRLQKHGYYKGKLLDGSFGPETKKAWQQFLRDKGYYKRAIDGDFGTYSVRALQQWLLDIKCYWNENGWCIVDGSWGEETTKAIQRAINSGKF